MQRFSPHKISKKPFYIIHIERKNPMTTLLPIKQENNPMHYEISKCIPQDEIPLLYGVLEKYSISAQAKSVPFTCKVKELYLLPSVEISGSLPLLHQIPELFYIEYTTSGKQARYLLHKRWKCGRQYGENSTLISKKQCQKILKNDLDFMKESDNTLLLEYYSKHQVYRYRPAFIISCKRKRHFFNHGKSQIAIDDEVQLSFSTNHFLSQKNLPYSSKPYASFRIQSSVEL